MSREISGDWEEAGSWQAGRSRGMRQWLRRAREGSVQNDHTSCTEMKILGSKIPEGFRWRSPRAWSDLDVGVREECRQAPLG